jgi:hypothetical protein
MNIIQKAIYKIAKLTESVPMENYPAGIDADDYEYRRLTDPNVKGLNPIVRDRQLDIVYNLFLRNGLAKRILELRNDFVFGDGFTYKVDLGGKSNKKKIKQCMDLLDEFWNENKMDLNFEKKGFDLGLNGMLILPAFINQVNGKVRLGFIDPKNVMRVISNPLNVEQLLFIELKGINPQFFENISPDQLTQISKELGFVKQDNSKLIDVFSKTKRLMSIIKVNEDFQNLSFGLLQGDCFYFQINSVSNQPEGVSDLLQTADWLDMLDQMLFSTVQYFINIHKYFQDVELTGADPKAIAEWKKANPVSTTLARFVHNDKVKYQILTPNIKQTDPSETVRLVKNLCLGSQGYPEMWFADGGNSNLATATAQGYPIIRSLKKRQKYVAECLKQILTFVIHQAFVFKREGFSLERGDLDKILITITCPEIDEANIKELADGVSKISDLVAKSIANKWISADTGSQIGRFLFDTIGYRIDEELEKQKIEEEKEIPPEVIGERAEQFGGQPDNQGQDKQNQGNEGNQ